MTGRPFIAGTRAQPRSRWTRRRWRSKMDRVPRVFASSLSDWDAFGPTWASRIADKAAVAPRIQAHSDKLTAGTSDRHEQSKRL